MNLSDSQTSTEVSPEILAHFRRKGIRLFLRDGNLHYRAVKGALTSAELDVLNAHKSQISAFLTIEGDAAGATAARRAPDRIPLAYSQLAHWHRNRLCERGGLREVASLTRILGRLNIDLLKTTLSEIAHRHEILRARILVIDGVPVQEILPICDCALLVNDLTGLAPGNRDTATKAILEKHLLQPIDLYTDPLFGLRLVKLSEDEHLLIVAMEHIISDGWSMNVLLRDLFAGYTQASLGRKFSLPPIPVQFSDFALWQRATEDLWIRKHGNYWTDRMAGYQEVRFPTDVLTPAFSHVGWATVPLCFDKNLKDGLEIWSRQNKTTLAMCIFTAYVGLVLRWCNSSDMVVGYLVAARVDPKLENAVGYFASKIFLRIELLGNDNFVDLMHRVTEEYCKAYEHIDFSYMESQLPPIEFTRSSVFNWLPQESKHDISGLEHSQDSITTARVPFAHPALKETVLEHDPMVVLIDRDGMIAGHVYFPLDRFRVKTMERFSDNIALFARCLIRNPSGRVKDIVLI